MINAFALFPGDRFVGQNTEGEFSMVLTDLDGNPVGNAFDEWPQLSQTFGADRRQATVSGTISMDSDPLPTSVLIGFRWDGPPGQESEIRFEAEAIFDPTMVATAESPEADPGGMDTGESSDISSSESAETTASADGADGSTDTGGFPTILIVIGVAVAGLAGTVLVRRSRT